jgi:hypothetical protein
MGMNAVGLEAGLQWIPTYFGRRFNVDQFPLTSPPSCCGSHSESPSNTRPVRESPHSAESANAACGSPYDKVVPRVNLAGTACLDIPRPWVPICAYPGRRR